MRKADLIACGAIAAVVLSCVVAFGGSSEGDSGDGGDASYGAMTCSDWAGRLSDGERWDAAEELLVEAKAADGRDGAPSTTVVEQFTKDLDTMCGRGQGDDRLETVTAGLYESNWAFYSL